MYTDHIPGHKNELSLHEVLVFLVFFLLGSSFLPLFEEVLCVNVLCLLEAN